MKYTEQDLKDEYEQAVKRKGKLYAEGYVEGLIDAQNQALILSGVVRCVCKIPEPRLKVSENGTYAYCEKCAKTYVQI